jgi:RNA polymerase sigma-70 factor, ECF subfamily
VNEQELDQLVARVQKGDRDAFTEVVFAIRKELRIFLSAHAASIDMVEEVLQSTLVECYECIGRYELRGTFLAWVKGIGRNLLLKELHARARYVTVEEDTLERIVVESALENTSEAADDRQLEMVERLRRCIQKLPDASRHLIERRYFERTTVKSLAKSLSRTETWTAVNLFRIREALRACMAGEVTP